MISIYAHRQAFSLVELSIVLVILGLLVGGILAGQALISASELRKVTSDLQRYESAIHAFRDKYFYYPGDLPNATQFWGMAASGTTCSTTASTGTETCDGNGDGAICDTTISVEPFRAWQHLANAGLVQGRYAGIRNGASIPYVAGTDVPGGPRANSLYAIAPSTPGTVMPPLPGTVCYLQYLSSASLGGASQNRASRGLILAFASSGIAGSTTPVAGGGIITQGDAINLDTKMDDGVPTTGRVRPLLTIQAGLGSNNVTSQGAVNCTYSSVTTDQACVALGYMFANIIP